MYEKSKVLFKEHFYAVIIYIVIFAFVWWLLLCGRDLQDNSNRIESVGAGINTATELVEQARTEQQVAEKGIDQAISRTETLQRSVEEADDIAGKHRASIERCQQLINKIKQRGKS